MTLPTGDTCEIARTKGGVLVVRDTRSGEVMHPGTGPLVEPIELYTGPSRLEARLSEGGDPLVLFDVGLGAASNAIAAWRVSESLPASARPLHIVSFENDLCPLRLALAEENAAAFGLNDSSARRAVTDILTAGRTQTARTSWRLSFGDLASTIPAEPIPADIVFWDPYSPKSAPSLWNSESFRRLREICRAGATVHTYSAATPTRSAMLLAGFFVGAGERTGTKGETTVAAVNVEDLRKPLDAVWLERLARSTSPFPNDVLPDGHSREVAMRRVRGLAQFQRTL